MLFSVYYLGDTSILGVGDGGCDWEDEARQMP